jgi:hypothetical protein
MRFPAISVALVASAFASAFLFPYPATLALSLAASAVFPPAGALVGLLSDALYLSMPGIPLATLLGCGASLSGLLVRRFAKARIMGA